MYTRECVVVDGCICMVRMYIRLYMRARVCMYVCTLRHHRKPRES